ncbi:MAG: TAXI family TRAP transporter solute-binding subunit [Rhodospirillales bacterium]|nr:TAXI family TRAP transporter solute-binding subunit [Rhodospirillales bacterium]
MKRRSALILSALVLVIGLGAIVYANNLRSYTISIAAGVEGSTSYNAAMAIRTVLKRHHGNFDVNVYTTLGPSQNAELVENNAVDVAFTEISPLRSGRARLVAELFNDTFQLVARAGLSVQGIGDLKGLRVAIPQVETNHHAYFWQLVTHFGLSETDLQTFPGSDKASAWLFANNAVDVVFRSRAIGGKFIASLLDLPGSHVIPIEQGAAIVEQYPFLNVSLISKGAYHGSPPAPQKDVPSIGSRRIAVASDLADVHAINVLTSVLFEHQHELAQLAPMLGNIAEPNTGDGMFLPVHEGARRYFERDNPNFFQENAEPIAVLISMIVVIASIYVHFLNKSRRRRLDAFNVELLALAHEARAAETFAKIDVLDSRLGDYVDKITHAAADGDVDSRDMSLFEFTFQATENAIRDRESQLKRRRYDEQNASLHAAD